MRKYLTLTALALLWLCFISITGCSSPKTESQSRPPASIKELDRSKETAIKKSLKSDKELAGESIRIKVINFEVTLLGTVETKEQKERAGQIAMKTPGINKVINKLNVRKR